MPVGLFDSDEPGERWAAHPDYAPSELLVSNRGRVRKRGHAGVGEYEYFTLGSLRKDGYRTVGINGKHRRVHILVCEAFHGPKPSGKNITVDHDRDRNRSNNRADNLRWATPQEQNGNQGTHRAHSTGKPVLARKVGSPDDAEWTPYASATAAGKALGIHEGNIRDVCNPEKGNKPPLAATSSGMAHRPRTRATCRGRSSARHTRASACHASGGSSTRRAMGARACRRAGACRPKPPAASAGPSGTRRGPRAARTTPP